MHIDPPLFYFALFKVNLYINISLYNEVAIYEVLDVIQSCYVSAIKYRLFIPRSGCKVLITCVSQKI